MGSNEGKGTADTILPGIVTLYSRDLGLNVLRVRLIGLKANVHHFFSLRFPHVFFLTVPATGPGAVLCQTVLCHLLMCQRRRSAVMRLCPAADLCYLCVCVCVCVCVSAFAS